MWAVKNNIGLWWWNPFHKKLNIYNSSRSSNSVATSHNKLGIKNLGRKILGGATTATNQDIQWTCWKLHGRPSSLGEKGGKQP